MFENEDDRKLHAGYYPPKVEIKDYNVPTDGKRFFDQPLKSNMRTGNNIRKVATVQGDDYTTGCLLYYNCFNNYYKMIAIDLGKQQVLHGDPKAIQKMNFTGNQKRDNGAIMFFIIEKAKKNKKGTFFTKNYESIVILYCFNIISV